MGDIYQKVIRVFIASPGGLSEEREAVRVAIEDVNRQNSAYWGIRFEAVGWEETIGGNRRAQSLINKDLGRANISLESYMIGVRRLKVTAR